MKENEMVYSDYALWQKKLKHITWWWYICGVGTGIVLIGLSLLLLRL